jgi:hypothetical protein
MEAVCWRRKDGNKQRHSGNKKKSVGHSVEEAGIEMLPHSRV